MELVKVRHFLEAYDKSYRSRIDLPVSTPATVDSSSSYYDNFVRMTSSMTSSERSVMESSFTSEDSTTLADISEQESTPTPSGTCLMTFTPVLRRRRSNNLQRRNYRIIAPDESLMILQRQNMAVEEGKRNKLSRRSFRKEPSPTSVSSPSMVITSPVLLTRTQSCSVCCRERPCRDSDVMTVTSSTRSRTEDDPARLSFVSSSTGYSSARSSLRSSDGTDDSAKRDSGIGSCGVSVSSKRRSVLLNKSSSLSQLDRIAIELLDTEQAYVHDLSDVIQGYLNFLVDKREELKITLDDISSLFGCIERIYAFNCRLYEQLDRADLDCVKMSRCFVQNSGKFEDYITYCTNYHRMLGTLTTLQEQSHIAPILKDRQSFLGHALPLSSYLLKPVQRILKYHLFLENMLKQLPDDISPDDQMCVYQAHQTMTAQAGRINDEKKRSEHSERVLQLQAAIQKWKTDESNNLLSYGDLLLEAQFKQSGSKAVRTLFLFEEMLLIVKQRNTSYICKDYIMSSNLMLNESICTEEPLAFQVLSFDNPRAQYIFLASNMDQKKVWMTELKRMMLDHYAIEIPEKTKQLMLSMDNTTQKVAFGRPEFAQVNMKNSKKVPKYLEKRRKSMDSQETRRRSLSATRLLGINKTDFTKMPDNDDNKCTCHKNPGPSSEKAQPIQPQAISRTLSASTIFHGDTEEPPKRKQMTEVQMSRSRYNQARNRRNVPTKQEINQPQPAKKIDGIIIDATFDELYNELVSYGNEQAAKLSEAERECNWRTHMPERGSRSKSLTRFDDYYTKVFDIDEPQIVERRYSKVDQMKKMKNRKTVVDGNDPGNGRLSLTERSFFTTKVGLPPMPSRPDEEKRQSLSARQRTALTAEQIAHLDQMLPSVGVVRSMIKSFEAS